MLTPRKVSHKSSYISDTVSDFFSNDSGPILPPLHFQSDTIFDLSSEGMPLSAQNLSANNSLSGRQETPELDKNDQLFKGFHQFLINNRKAQISSPPHPDSTKEPPQPFKAFQTHSPSSLDITHGPTTHISTHSPDPTAVFPGQRPVVSKSPRNRFNFAEPSANHPHSPLTSSTALNTTTRVFSFPQPALNASPPSQTQPINWAPQTRLPAMLTSLPASLPSPSIAQATLHPGNLPQTLPVSLPTNTALPYRLNHTPVNTTPLSPAPIPPHVTPLSLSHTPKTPSHVPSPRNRNPQVYSPVIHSVKSSVNPHLSSAPALPHVIQFPPPPNVINPLKSIPSPPTPNVSMPPLHTSHSSKGELEPVIPYNAIRTPDDVNQQDPFSSLVAIKGRFIELLTSQLGCRFFQDCLAAINQQTLASRPTQANLPSLHLEDPSVSDSLIHIAVDVVFQELQPQLIRLSTDRFANYAIQALMTFASDRQTFLLLSCFPDQTLRTMACNLYGTRFVQTCIKRAAGVTMLEQQLTRAFTGQVYSVLDDAVGVHAILSFVKFWSPDTIDWIVYDSIHSVQAQAAREMHIECLQDPTQNKAKNQPHYFYLLQKLCTQLTDRHKTQIGIVLIPHLQLLSCNPSTNYLVQDVVKANWLVADPSGATSRLFFSAFVSLFVSLCTHKIASNVMDCVIVHCDPTTFSSLVILVVSDATIFNHLCQDPFANYVVQKMCAQAKGNDRALLIAALEREKKNLSSHPYARRIVATAEQSGMLHR